MANFASKYTGQQIEEGLDKALRSEVVNSDDKNYWDSKANGSHNHSAGDVTSGILTVPRGGTGRGTLTANSFLRGNGTGAVALSSPADALIDMGGALGGSGYVDDLNTCNYRGLYACNPSTLNTPTGGYGACLNIPFANPASFKQIYFEHLDETTIYQRSCDENKYSEWRSSVKAQMSLILPNRTQVDYSTKWQNRVCPLTETLGTVGVGIRPSSLGITVDDSRIKHVEVSGSLSVMVPNYSEEIGLLIKKDGSRVVQSIANAVSDTADGIVSLSIPPVLVPVSGGNRFTLEYYHGATGTLHLLERSCVLTVKAV